MSTPTPMSPASPSIPRLTRKDFMSDQEVRWCPGCGDYSILAQVQKVLPDLGIPRENLVFIAKALLSAACMAAAVCSVHAQIGGFLSPPPAAGKWIKMACLGGDLGVSGLAGIAVFVAFSAALRMKEWEMICSLFCRRHKS